MKKLICLSITLVMVLFLCVPATAVQAEDQPTFVPESVTQEELLAMDYETDSDGDGLSDVLELVYKFNRYGADTDGDGVSDYTEFCITCTDVLAPDGDVDTDGDGLTNAQEAVYGTNPDDLDTDNDNLGDYEEIIELATDPLVKDNPDEQITADVLSPGLSGKSDTGANTLAIGPNIGIDNPGGGSSAFISSLCTSYDEGETYNCSPITYTMNTDWFFFDKTEFNSQLAIISSILSALAYDFNSLHALYNGHVATSEEYAVLDWMEYHLFDQPAQSYDLDDNEGTNPDGFTDQHVSEMFIGHKSATYGSSTKNIICVVIRGTNNTLDEWQSNFDLGTTSNFYSTSGWTNSSNHMGFDITANRLNTELDDYMSANGLTSSNSVLWITGHSRGGALANVLAAKRIDAGYNVYAYTFAAPATTTSSTATSTKYNSIFNIINTDDLVPQLPLNAWGFVRYGVDKSASINDTYANDWDNLTGWNYSHSQTAQSNALSQMTTIAANRNSCYLYPGGSFNITSIETYLSKPAAENAVFAFVAQYPSVASGRYRYQTYGELLSFKYVVEYQPSMLMMLLAEALSHTEIIEQLPFAICHLPTSLDTPRDSLLSYAISKLGKALKHPHYVEGYYLLSKELD